MQELKIGEHYLRFEPPDIYLARGVGNMDEAQMDEAIDAIEVFAAGRKRFLYGISDLRQFGTLNGGSRRAMVRLFPLLKGVALIGIKAPFRTTLSLVRKAAALLSREVSQVSLVFVDNEDDARAWIASKKERASQF